jgi:hypothetical protein
MTTNDLFAGANVIISIKATFEVRDESGLKALEKTPGELALTEKEFVFLEVKGTFRKNKNRLHAYPTDKLVGYGYSRWGRGPTTLYLTIENNDGSRQNYFYTCSKGAYDKFIKKVKERKLI